MCISDLFIWELPAPSEESSYTLFIAEFMFT